MPKRSQPELCREASSAYQPGGPPGFQLGVLSWGTAEHLRDFPWRQTRDPYRLLISELMLRRTQARQVAPVYLDFCQCWPDLPQFIAADPEEVATVLWPLGLKWRIQNLLQVREALTSRGHVPDEYHHLLSLPGVGDYVASAVLCFSQREARPLIDTNTVRVIGRYFGLQIHPGTRRLNSFRQLAQSLVPADRGQASAYHYSLLDLAATVCRPTRPQCNQCPLAAECRGSKIEGASSPTQEFRP